MGVLKARDECGFDGFVGVLDKCVVWITGRHSTGVCCEGLVLVRFNM